MPVHIHVVSGFIHRELCEQMIAHAKSVLDELDAKIEEITWVPGTLEVPLAVKVIIEKKRPDAIVIFGFQQRGKTKHGEVIAQAVTTKLLELQLAFSMPMAVAIIGPNATLLHARRKARFVSEKAIRAAVHMAGLMRNLKTK